MVTKYRIIISAIALLLTGGIGTLFFVSGPQTPGDTEIVASQRDGSTPKIPEKVNTDFFLLLDEPKALDFIVKTPQISIEGRTRIDAMVTINQVLVEPNIDGKFQQTIPLEPGLNIVTVIASVVTGDQKTIVLGIGYTPEQ
jgi:hypothetical protein